MNEVGIKRGSEGGTERLEGDKGGHTQGRRVQGKKRRVETSSQDTVVGDNSRQIQNTRQFKKHSLRQYANFEQGQDQCKEIQSSQNQGYKTL